MTIPEIISQMTLEEKAALLTGKIPGIFATARVWGWSARWSATARTGCARNVKMQTAVYSKIVLMLSASPPPWAWRAFHPDALAKLGETLGEECQAEDVSILLGPGVNMKRSPLCGRNF